MTYTGGKMHNKTSKKHHISSVGSRAEVFHGKAMHTSGGLEKHHLKKNKHGSIVSKKASRTAKRKKTIRRLHNAGYKAKKGEFKLFKKSSKKQRGGYQCPGGFYDSKVGLPASTQALYCPGGLQKHDAAHPAEQY